MRGRPWGTSSRVSSNVMTTPHSPLPPQPDVNTGTPRPPRAPRSFGGNDVTPTDRRPRNHPPSPEERGPILEWRQETPRSAVWMGVVTALIILGLPTVNSWSVTWVLRPSLSFFWILSLGGGWLIYKIFSNAWLAAGATWLQNGRYWVDVYQLTRVEVKASGVNQMLRLRDSAGREIGSLKLGDVQRNQDLWDLVYNGIRHSVAAGSANPSPGSRRILELPADFGA